MMTKMMHAALAAVLATALCLATPARATVGPARAPIRVMTYNTALMNLEASTEPNQFTVSIDTNKDSFGGQPYNARVAMISDWIKQEDPDVVVLNEVWNDDQKGAFAFELAANGPYKSYIYKIKGETPGMNNPYADPGLSTATAIQLFATILGNPSPSNAVALAFINATVCPLFAPACLPFGITDVKVHMQDSGLMLFSRYNFVKFDSPNFVPLKKGVTVEGWNEIPNQPPGPWGMGPEEVGVTVYEVARGMDQLSSKAAGMVRIQLAPSSIADIVFSHSNADEKAPEENADVRAYQMNQVKKMITNDLTVDEMATEQVYMLGDLNTPGHNKKTGKIEEWSTLYGNNAVNSAFKNNPGVFFACGDAASCTAAIKGQKLNAKGAFLTDSWGFETSPVDLSKTNYLDNQYYDYILHNKPLRQCMQHIRIGSEMIDFVNGEQLSDHLPVHADFNLQAPRCSPNLDDPTGSGPTVVTLTSDHHVETFDQNKQARITHPGSMQWYYLPEPGTYWINLLQGADHVAFDVYNDYDLSDPIPPYDGQTDPRKGRRWVTYNPIYIRVYGAFHGQPDRNWVGTYSLQLWRATGATPDDSIHIGAARPTKYNWVSSGTNQPQVWFDFQTNQTIWGEFAKTTLISEAAEAGTVAEKWRFNNQLWVQIPGSDPHLVTSYTSLNGELMQANPNGFEDFVNPDKQKNPNQQVTGWQVEMPKLAGTPNNVGTTDPKTYLFRLEQDGSFSFPPGQPPQFLYTWLTLLTDLQYLRPAGLQAKEPAYFDHEIAMLGFNFDGNSDDYCGFPNGANCYLFGMNSPDIVHIPMDDVDMKGPFKVTAVPTAWVFPKGAPPVQIGHNGQGSQIDDIWIQRGTVGRPDCKVNDPKQISNLCYDMGMSSPYDSPKYSYHLFWGISHEVNLAP